MLSIHISLPVISFFSSFFFLLNDGRIPIISTNRSWDRFAGLEIHWLSMVVPCDHHIRAPSWLRHYSIHRMNTLLVVLQYFKDMNEWVMSSYSLIRQCRYFWICDSPIKNLEILRPTGCLARLHNLPRFSVGCWTYIHTWMYSSHADSTCKVKLSDESWNFGNRHAYWISNNVNN